MRAHVSRCKSDKNSGSRHCRAARSCQRCFVLDLSKYRCILKSCLSFFVMNRENFKQAFFHQLMCFLSVFNFVVTLNFHVIRHVIMSLIKSHCRSEIALLFFQFNSIIITTTIITTIADSVRTVLVTVIQASAL